jgi:hypothetical protein
MTFGGDSGSVNDLASETTAHAPGASRAARALGRGLEDVSHLFFPASLEAGERSPAVDRPIEHRESPPVARAGAAVLRPRHTTKDLLIATLRECQSALGESLRVIDARLPCEPCGEIDLLALDHANVVTIIDVDTVAGDALPIRGVSHVDWVVRNMAHVRRMHPGSTIDIARQPRLLVVAPGFPPFLLNAIRQISQPDIRCFKYHAVELAGGTGILFERVSGESA